MTTPTPAPNVPLYGDCFICFGMRPCENPAICYPPPKPETTNEQEPEQ